MLACLDAAHCTLHFCSSNAFAYARRSTPLSSVPSEVPQCLRDLDKRI